MEKKECTKCKNKKEKKEFNKNKTRRDGLQNICKVCSREKSKSFYKNNIISQRKIIYRQKKERRNENRKLINEYLGTHPCVDCKNNNIIVLEFDHREQSQKSMAISVMLAGGYSWKKIKKEIDKCDVRCANCHRIRTATQLGYIDIFDLWKV